jgi:hypothetical protein
MAKKITNIEFKNDPTYLNVREYYPESFLKPFPKYPSKDPNKLSKSYLTVHIKDATIV